ncbi:MAG TPA: bifunctional methylenetetrahydrofolate dehydrogenase/methenyltetrahydrofolate cyclohydrolase [Alphaproteobacteria bacterium]|nr:bifunctional methylenetetrahydrofolate dehydrogenase/methenyltetrahydrofolate cyclohydrolase [Alphaproteobacteria bacterium]
MNMISKVIASKTLVEILKEQAKQKVKEINEKLGVRPALTILMAGNNPASVSYVTKKIELAKECGMKSEIIYLNENSSQEYDKITTELNNNKDINGFMLQLPCPIELENGFNINSEKDVDCLTEVTYQKMLTEKQDAFSPCTPLGILRYLEFLGVEISGTNFAIIGKSRLVGKPLFELLLNSGGTVTLCHSRTKDLAKSISTADVVISAVGKPNLLNQDNIQEGQILIDVGINKVEGKLCGDIAKDAVEKAKIITPVPGGVGPLTVMSLITNTIDACYMQNGLARPTWKVQ